MPLFRIVPDLEGELLCKSSGFHSEGGELYV